MYDSNDREVLTSGIIGQSNGTSVAFSFDAKAIDYTTQVAVGEGDCTFTGYWSADGTNWTPINILNSLSSSSCNTYTYNSFTPTFGEDVYVRIEAQWVVGDFYVVIDDVSVVQSPDGSCDYSNIISGKRQSGGLNINLFPNPFSDMINLEFSHVTESQDVLIQLYDELGKLVFIQSLSLVDYNSAFQLQLKHLPESIYLMKLISPIHTYSYKLIRKN